MTKCCRASFSAYNYVVLFSKFNAINVDEFPKPAADGLSLWGDALSRKAGWSCVGRRSSPASKVKNRPKGSMPRVVSKLFFDLGLAAYELEARSQELRAGVRVCA